MLLSSVGSRAGSGDGWEEKGMHENRAEATGKEGSLPLDPVSSKSLKVPNFDLLWAKTCCACVGRILRSQLFDPKFPGTSQIAVTIHLKDVPVIGISVKETHIFLLRDNAMQRLHLRMGRSACSFLLFLVIVISRSLLNELETE